MRPASRPVLIAAIAIALTARNAAAQTRSTAGQPATWDEKRIALPLVRTGVAYVPRTPTSHVVVLISGDTGWNAMSADLARRIAARSALVIGLSLPALKRAAAPAGGCWYVASDLEIMSHAAQKTLNRPQYHPPILVGYAAGASVVYAALANTPAVTFAGGVGIGFCPTLAIRRAICAGDAWDPDYDERTHVNRLPPTKALPKDWHILNGAQDQTCPADRVDRFAAGMPRTHLVDVGASRRPAAPQTWAAPFDRALESLWTEKESKPAAAEPRSATTRELEDELQRLQLPLEFRWPAAPSALVVFYSGDGGWASLDEELAEQLVAHGVGVVGVSSLRYFWTAKTPAQVAADLRRVVSVLARSRVPVFVGGFSFGAESSPVALKEWPVADRRLVAGLVLVAPGPSASFEIDPLDWIRRPEENPATRVAPAIRSLGLPAVCVAGLEEDDSPCPRLAGAPGVRVVRLPGSHHFNSDYAAVADAVNAFIRAVSDRRP